MKLTSENIRSFIAEYDVLRSQGYLWPFLSDQDPLAKMRSLVGGDDDAEVLDCIRPFFQMPINPNSETFKVLIKCFRIDNADAKRLYSLFIHLEKFGLVTVANYDKIVAYGDLDNLILYVADLANSKVLNQLHLDFVLRDPATLRKMQAAVLVLNSHQIVCEEIVSLAEQHNEPEIMCTAALWLKHADLLTLENLFMLHTKPNLEAIVKAISYSLHPAKLLNQTNLNLITKSVHPRYMADLIVLLKAQRLENHIESLDKLIDPRGLWVMLNSMEKGGLVTEYNLIDLLDCEWLATPEAAEILMHQQQFVWTEKLVADFLSAMNKRDIVTAVTKIFNGQGVRESVDDDDVVGLKFH